VTRFSTPLFFTHRVDFPGVHFKNIFGAHIITVCKVDVDRVSPIAEKYGVTAIPTVLIIKDGKEIKQLLGLQSEIDYITPLDKLVDKDRD